MYFLRALYGVFWLVFLWVLTACSANIKFYPHFYPGINYLGAKAVSQDFVALAYSGFQIRCTTTAKQFKLKLADFSKADQANYLYIQVNHLDTTLALTPDVLVYDLSTLFTADTSLVLIHKLTEAAIGKIHFYGLETNANAQLWHEENKLQKIVWVGNSITCGYGNKVQVAAPPKGNPNTGFHSVNQDNYWAWGSIVARALHLDAVQLCYSGKGLTQNFDGSTHLLIKDLLTYALPDEQTELDLNDVFAPVFVLHVGTNDFGCEAHQQHKQVDSAAFIDALHQLFFVIKQINPQANVVVVASNLTTNYYPKMGLSRLQHYLQMGINSYPQSSMKFSYLALQSQEAPYGENWHPSLLEHQKMANQILPILQDILNKY